MALKIEEQKLKDLLHEIRLVLGKLTFSSEEAMRTAEMKVNRVFYEVEKPLTTWESFKKWLS